MYSKSVHLWTTIDKIYRKCKMHNEVVQGLGVEKIMFPPFCLRWTDRQIDISNNRVASLLIIE